MGQSSHNPPSRFIKDLPPELVHQAQQTVEHAYQQRPTRPRQPSWSTMLGDVQPTKVRVGADDVHAQQGRVDVDRLDAGVVDRIERIFDHAGEAEVDRGGIGPRT